MGKWADPFVAFEGMTRDKIPMDLAPCLGSVQLRPVTIGDAGFIVATRASGVEKGFLHAGADSEGQQRVWLERYLESADPTAERYFVVLESSRPAGLLRIRELQPGTDFFSWGSWCMVRGTPFKTVIASFVLANDLGFAHKGKSAARFEIARDNRSLLRFHRRTGALAIGEAAGQVQFILTRAAFEAARARFVSRWWPA